MENKPRRRVLGLLDRHPFLSFINMKISIKKNNIPLAYSFEYFLDTLNFLPYAEITVKTKDGLIGRGEIACALDVNGEESASAVNLAPAIEHILGGMDIKSEKDIAAAMQRCELNIAFNKATKCGLEQALFSILAQRKNKTVAQLLGAKNKAVRIQCTIPFLASQEAYVAKFTELFKKSPDFFKLKIGKNINLEAWAINKLRSLNKKVQISVDANQAFPNAAAAGRFLKKVEKSKLCWAEQLLEKNDFTGWQELKKRAKVPLMADEGIHTPRDARLYLQNGLVDVVNIKLAKCGGILEARKIIAIAKEFKVPVMLGSMVHSELGLKYNLAFGLSEDFITYDFYSYFSLKKRAGAPLIDINTLAITKAARQ